MASQAVSCGASARVSACHHATFRHNFATGLN
jgi:hypothetical protein